MNEKEEKGKKDSKTLCQILRDKKRLMKKNIEKATPLPLIELHY